jgi:CBS domain-containing protein
MWEHDCGCLPVCTAADGTELTVGVITDRDICMRAMFSGKLLQELRVEEAMAKQVLTCQLGDTLEHVEQVMRSGRVHRLPVVSEEGPLAGLISLADLACEAARESARIPKILTETDVADTLGAICMRPVQSQSA